MPQKLFAVCREGLYHDVTVEDYAAIYGEYEDGASMQFITTTGEYPGTNRLEIVGERGKLVLEEGKLVFYRLSASEGDVRFSSDESMPKIPCTVEEYRQEEPERAHCGILENFTDAILDGSPLLADGREGRFQLMLTNAAYLSAFTNTWVSLPFDEDLFDQLYNEKRKSEKEKKPSAVSGEGKDDLSRWKVNW